MIKGKIATIALMLMMLSLPLAALDSATGLEIIEKVYYRDAPEDQKGNLTMILENTRGDQRVRNISQYIIKTEDMEKKIMFFNAPADVRNTSFMNWSYTGQDKEDSQWIYLPALRKIKRISSGGSSDYFMGSDFTYDDLGDRRPQEDSHRLTGEEMIGGEMCYVVESTPLDDDYMYSKTVSWIVPGKWLVLKKEFYDEDGDELKTLRALEYREIDGYWMIVESEMRNLQKDHRTGMKFENLELDSGIEERIFSERVMMRGIR